MIIKYIVKSLEQRDTVFVSGLGLFEKYYQSAEIINDKINPPYNGIKFDPNFDGNGFNFEMFVAQQEGKLISETSQTISEWVKDLKNAIDNNKSVSFENFGTFAKDAKGVIAFACDRIPELNIEFEGLNPVSIGNVAAETVQEWSENEDITEQNSTVEHQDVVKEETENVQGDAAIVVEEPVEEPEVDETTIDANETEIAEPEELQPMDESMEDDSSDGKESDEKGKHRGLIITIIIVLILALLAAAAYYFRTPLTDLYHQYFDKNQVEVVQDVENQNIAVEPVLADTAIMEADTDFVIEQVVEDEEFANSTYQDALSENLLSEDGDFIVDYEKGRYYVIVGSFRTEKEVRRHISERNLESYHPKAVRQSGQNLRVCIGIFSTEQAAENFGRKSGRNYWVLK